MNDSDNSTPSKEIVLSGVADSISPWSIKAFPNEARKLVIAAARRDGVSVAVWLERTVREKIQDDRLPQVAQGMALVKPPDPEELPELVRLARELTPQGQDSPLLREARATIRARLKGIRRG